MRKDQFSPVTDAMIIQAATTSKSMSAAGRSVGLSRSVFERRARLLGVYDSQRFDRKKYTPLPKIPTEDILTGKHPTYPSSALHPRLISEGIFEARCAHCARTEHFGSPIVFELHHVNGVSSDHRKANLQILCPNCHGLTDSFAKRKEQL